MFKGVVEHLLNIHFVYELSPVIGHHRTVRNYV